MNQKRSVTKQNVTNFFLFDIFKRRIGSITIGISLLAIAKPMNKAERNILPFEKRKSERRVKRIPSQSKL
jgi:hypothetical protein